jgi:hypothetical protein
MADAFQVGKAGQIDQWHINGWPTIDQLSYIGSSTIHQRLDSRFDYLPLAKQPVSAVVKSWQ